MAKDPSLQSDAFSSNAHSPQYLGAAVSIDGATFRNSIEPDPKMLHFRWVLDSPVLCEPMKIAVSRQLARVAGKILFSTTDNDEHARSHLERFLGNKLDAIETVRLLNEAVNALDQSVTGFNDATDRVYSAVEKAIAPVSMTSEQALGLLVALSNQSCKLMLDEMEMAQPPQSGGFVTWVGQSDLVNRISTVFGQEREVESIEVAFVRGMFSRALRKALETAHQDYQALDATMRGRTMPESTVGSAVRVELTELHSEHPKTSSFKIAPQGFRDAYLKANLDYILGFAAELRADASKQVK